MHRSETTEIHSVWPTKPYFLTFPEDAHITTADPTPLPSATGEPTGTSFAPTPMEIYSTDSAPVRTTDSRVCGWIITRTWTIRAQYHDCPEGVPRGSPVSTSQDQLIFIGDVTPPVFLPVPQNVRIPFFSNYQTTSPIPSTDDPVSSYFQNIGLVSTPIVLTSRDSNFVRAKETDNQVQSQTDGLARFTRTWTIADTCGNTQEAVQHIAIEHPGTSVQRVQSFLIDGNGAFSIAADILQQVTHTSMQLLR